MSKQALSRVQHTMNKDMDAPDSSFFYPTKEDKSRDTDAISKGH